MTRSILSLPFHRVEGRNRPLFVPRRSRHVPPDRWVRFPREIPARWQAIARAKGFRIDRGVRDKDHLALECLACGAHTAQKVFTLRTAQPACGACQEARLRETAEAAGLTFLGQCASHRHYGAFLARCGHVVRRQFELVGRIARGATRLRCETCLLAREEAEATRKGWRRIGPDPKGNPNYRLYRHLACGHEQRIARPNMQWGQCDCAQCGESWSAKPSFIYLFEIALPGLTVLKLGYSSNPVKRHRHQLGLAKEAQVEVLRTVAIATGHAAVAQEKACHAYLARHFPTMIVPKAVYGDALNVVSEIYRPELEPEIHRLLDAIEAGLRPAA